MRHWSARDSVGLKICEFHSRTWCVARTEALSMGRRSLKRLVFYKFLSVGAT